MPSSVDFSHYIKLIGKGKKAGRYLTQAEALDAMQQVLNEDASPEQIGAFLMLLRMREESPEELAGFLQACRSHSLPFLRSLDSIDLDLGCYAGKRRHLPWFVLAVMLLAQNGYRVFLHGTAEPESQRLYLDKVWQAFGWPVAKTATQADNQLSNTGFCYMDLAYINPGLQRLIQLRSTLGLRSCANTLARMLNPVNAKNSLHGVFHKHFDTRHIGVAELLSEHNVSCFRGEGGEVEVNPERDFTLHRYSQGETSQLLFPSLLPNWQIKPRELTVSTLQKVWFGEVEDNYGQAAIIGSLAVMLSILKNTQPCESVETAQRLWENRRRTWPEFTAQKLTKNERALVCS